MKKINKRKNIRLQKYDYSKNGYYFVTICVKNRLNLLGKTVGPAILSEIRNNLPNFLGQSL